MQEQVIQGFRLSPQQNHLWLLQQATGSRAYRAMCAALIEGPVDRAALIRALESVVERHEILRTTFQCFYGMTIPVQVKTDSGVLFTGEYDLTGLDRQEQGEKIEEVFNEAKQVSFDYEQGPLVHASLINLSDDKNILLVSLPALCADAASLKNLLREISRSYSACLNKEQLTDEPLQYIIVSEWQNDLFETEDFEVGKKYWRKQDLSALNTLKLPFNKGSFRAEQFDPEYLTFAINQTEVEKIDAVVNRYGVSVSVFLLACWQTLLWRLTGQSEIIVGAGYEGRPDDELETAIGLFAKYLPIHSHLNESLKFSQLLTQVNKTALEVYGWQEWFSWEQIEGTTAEATENRFFPLCFDYAEEATEQQAAGVRIKIYRQQTCTDRFDLKLSCSRRGAEIEVEMGYDPAIYDRAEIERLTRQYEKLVSSVLEASDTPVSKLDLIPDEQLHQLLVEFNDTNNDYTGDLCIHELFERQAERTPEATAVVYEQEEVTYRELNERANQLARYLKKQGVEPEQVVGLCVERSIEMVEGLLGILKAGGAYLPMDVGYPRERLRYMLEQTGARLVLTQGGILEGLEWEGVKVVRIEKEREKIGEESREKVESEVRAKNLAYVIYTSGSTGQPKGVMIEHRSPVNLLAALEQAVYANQVDSSLRVSLNAPLSFDASVQQLMLLARGVALHIIPLEIRTDGKALLSYLERNNIEVFDCTPSQLGILLEAGLLEDSGFAPKLILVAGEAIDESLWNILGQARRTKFYNIYGPTESTVDATFCPIDEQTTKPSIGRPLGNYQIYVLDDQLRPVPIGMKGELHIAGAGLARSYYNRPELTAEKFIPNPFTDAAGGRLYKTGDLGRYLPDGRIEFLGRLDYQVKLRGYRIEIGEIESILEQHPGVQETIVIARKDASGENRLIAYIVANDEAAPVVTELRNYIKERLPEYMVPASFILLDSLPLTPNGKVDRNALPQPDQARPELETTYIAPRGPIEEVVAGIWNDLLGIEQIGIYDNFFELGGHSLLATQVASRIREIFNVELPLRAYFDAPNVAGISEKIEEARHTEQGVQAPPIERVSRDRELPLAFAQQRLWFLDQLMPESTAYNIPVAVRVTGRLNVAALEYSISELVRRHEPLRTTFVNVGGRAVQVIAPAESRKLPIVDLSELPEQEREAAANRLALQDAIQTFDLAQGPVLRTMLVKLAEEEHIVLMTMHHIVWDGWSTRIVYGEIAEFYKAYVESREATLPELQIQYADFAVWQREWLQGEVLEAQLKYWEEKLKGVAILALPTDRPRPPVQTFDGDSLSLPLSHSLSEAVYALSRREGVTLFMALLAVFETLLHRYTGQDDITIGTDVANRNQAVTEALIGFFVNQLVLRADLSGDPTFQELLARVREMALGGYAHQELPFEMLVERLQPVRSLSYPPLYQVMFGLQDAVVQKQVLELPDLTLNSLGEASQVAKFDITLYMEAEAGNLVAGINYNTALFDADTIQRMLQHLEVLLEAIVANPKQRLSQYPLLPESERHKLLVEFNQTGVDFAWDKRAHEIFEEQAARTPNAIAVTHGQQRLSYDDLNRRANRVARSLRDQGVSGDVVVALLAERGIDLLTSILGVFKAGGAYLPLDPHHPAGRIQQVLEQSRTGLVIAARDLAQVITQATESNQSTKRPQVLVMEELAEQEDDSNLGVKTEGGNLAYVIYTSGSTGIPKGVMVQHQGMLNHLYAKINDLQVTDHDVIAQTASQCFDISVWQFLSALLVGGRVDIIGDEVAHDPHRLVEQVAGEGITILETVPSLLREMLEQKAISESTELEKRGLRWLILTGEVLPPGLCRRVLTAMNVPVMNAYGPTECSDDVTHYVLTEAPAESVARIPIGRAIANTQLYILDEWLEPTPIGVAGELCVSGVGVGRGYLNDAKRTAEAFISDPYSTQPGARLYKTGDLARYLADGNIEILGRKDHQVKVRGYRIELGEIESVLGRYPGAQECAVLIREDETGDKRIVAYIVAEQETPLNVNETKRWLKEKLPEYMVPDYFVALDEMPLTPNGKIDRKALPAPAQARDEFEQTYVAPRTPIEEVIAGIWIQVLGIDRVGAHDNFFDLGGHSLLATQVISRMREPLQVELPLRALFESPTVAGLAASAEKERREKQGLPSVPLVPIPRDGNMPLSYAQQRLWFLDQLNPGNPAFNIPVHVRLKGELNIEALELTLNEIVLRHEVLRTSFSEVNGRPIQVISPTQPMTLPVIDLRGIDEEELEHQVILYSIDEADRPFDLAKGPLLRAVLLKLGEQDHVVLFTLHHIVSDGWSAGILIEEVSALYHAFSAGKPSPLPALTIQYADFANWQRQSLQGEVLDSHITYWKKQLQGVTPLNLEADKPRPPSQSYKGEQEAFSIPKPITEALKNLSRQEGATLFMTLLAALQTLLHRHTGQDDIVVGTDIANRNRAETERLIGFFVNMLPMRTDFSGNPSFRQLLGRVRQVALEAYAHQDLPFEQLVATLQLERDLSRHPVFQVVLVLFNAPSQGGLELPGLALTPLPISSPKVKFDLILFLIEGPEGLVGHLDYNTDIFEAPTVVSMLGHLSTLLQNIVAEPDSPVNSLDILTEEEKAQRILEDKERQESNRKRLISRKRKAVNLSEVNPIKTSHLGSEETMPLVIEPNLRNVILADWAESNRSFIEASLLKHGAVLFRGFNVRSISEFENSVRSICPDLFGEYGDLPREGLSSKVYGSTPYPADQPILFHNESSHMHRWPLKIWFFCVQAAEQGGETPIVDCRKVYQLLDPDIRDRFAQKGIMYVRNYTDGLDVSWQEFFRTTDKSAVEDYCRKAGIDFQWKDGNGLRTSQVCQAVTTHPKTGEPVFFNQLQLHHFSFLEPRAREVMLSLFQESEYPRNVYYGDGSVIEDSVLEQVTKIYMETAIYFPWQEGDILMLDNMLTAHGRNTFVGPRKIVVAMGEIFTK